jgi:hypothetical protein
MKFIFVLEDDLRFQNDLYEALKAIDPKLHIRFFKSLADFHEWLKLAAHEGSLALAKGGQPFHLDTSPPVAPAANHELKLVISKDEFLGTRNLNLARRARDFFIRRKICTAEDPTALILTSFDNPSFDIKIAQDRIINNVIFKPFDSLILKQDLEYGIIGRHPIKDGTTIASFKVNSTIEMLKEAPIKSLSEIGFTTINNAEIQIGVLSKYYSPLFEAENKKSMFATCYSCKQLSEKEFSCEFHFFAAETPQIAQIRRQLLTDKSHTLEEFQNSQDAQVRVLILDETGPAGLDLKVFVSERFSNSEVYFYSSFAQLVSDLNDRDTTHRQTLPKQIDYIFAHYDAFVQEKDKRWAQICEYIKARNDNPFEVTGDPDLFLFSQYKLSNDEARTLTPWCKELFFTPFDKLYISKKLTNDFKNFNNKNPITIASRGENSKIKIANPVDIIQISEAGLVMKYYRTISIGAFREFMLWRPNETVTSEIIATVNFHEKSAGSEEQCLNHFVFFGMKDVYLKHIRLWLRDLYIKQKDSA